MQNSDRKKDNKKLDRQYKILAKNTFYQIFNRYGTYIFSLISSFLLARMISQELWGFLIITTSILGIFTLIISFIPPGLIYSLHYYIPHYRAQNKMKIVRSFILKTFYIRIIVVMCVYIISLCLFLFFTDIFAINLKNYIFLLYILSPIIVIESLHTFLIAVMYGFNLFKSVFILLLIRNFVSISLLLSYFIFIGTIDIEVVAFINLFSSLIPFLVSTFIVALKMIKINVTPENGLNFKEVFEKTLKYGGLLSIQTIASGLWAQSEIQVIGLFEPPEWVTGYSISSHYSSVNGLFLSSLSYPLQYTLSSLDYKENFSKIVKIYKVVFNFSLFFLALITGILFFFVDFFFSFFYGDTYLIYSTLAKLMVISPVFGVLYNLYFSFLRATNQVKLTLMIFSITFSLSISLFWIGLINFGIIGAVFGLMFSKVFIVFILLFFNNKITKLKFDYLKMIFNYSIFFISLFVSLFLGDIFLNDLNYQILQFLNLLFFRYINFLQIFSFLIIFFALHIIFKTISKSDLENIELIFAKDKASHKMINKFIRFLSKFLR